MWGWIRMCLSFFFNKNLNSSILLFKSDDTVLLFRKKKKRVFCFVCSQSEPWRLLARWFLHLSLAPLHSVSLEYLHHIHHPPCRVPRSPLRRAFTLLMAGFCLKLTRSPLAADSTLWHEAFSSVAVHSSQFYPVLVSQALIIFWIFFSLSPLVETYLLFILMFPHFNLRWLHLRGRG